MKSLNIRSACLARASDYLTTGKKSAILGDSVIATHRSSGKCPGLPIDEGSDCLSAKVPMPH